MALTNTRSLRDVRLVQSIALPAAAATAVTASIDLQTATSAGRIPGVEVAIDVPATPNLVDAKTVSALIEDSADNSTFATLINLGAVQTGASGAGGTVYAFQGKLPVATRRYIRGSFSVLTAGGSNIAVTASVALVF